MYFQDIFAISVYAGETDLSGVQVSLNKLCRVRLTLMQVPSTEEVLPCLLPMEVLEKRGGKNLSVFLLSW